MALAIESCKLKTINITTNRFQVLSVGFKGNNK